MIDAVESVAANAALEPFIGPRIYGRAWRHVPMKPRVENRHLRNMAQQLLNYLHAFQLCACVQRRELGSGGDRRLHLGRDQNRLFVTRSAMNNAMSHDVDLRGGTEGLCFAAPNGNQQMLHRLRARRDLDSFLAPDAARVLDQSHRVGAVPLNPAFPQASRRICGKGLANLVETGLLTAGTRIEREDLHWSVWPAPVLHFRHVVAMLMHILFVLDQLVAQELLEVCADALQSRSAIHNVARQMVAV